MSLLQKIKEFYYMNVKRDRVSYARKLGVRIGKNCQILTNPKVAFGTEPWLIKIGDNVRINAGVNFITHDGGVWVLRKMKPELSNIDLIKPISVGDNVHIGTNVTIMPGVKIGNNVIVGLGAVVTKSIPDNSIVAGVPARVIETIDAYYEKHRNEFIFTKNLTKSEKKIYLKNKFQFFNES